MTDKFKMAR